MKVEQVNPEPVQLVVVITLTAKEASHVRAVLSNSALSVSKDLYNRLLELGY